MYHPNISSCSQSSTLSNHHANAITLSTWFVNLYIFKPPENTSFPSKLDILFLPDNGASICVLNLLTFTILADHILKCSKSTPNNIDNALKTLTVTNKAAILISDQFHSHSSFLHSWKYSHSCNSVCNCKYQLKHTWDYFL